MSMLAVSLVLVVATLTKCVMTVNLSQTPDSLK